MKMNRQFRLWRDKGEGFFREFARPRIFFQKSSSRFMRTPLKTDDLATDSNRNKELEN